MPRSASVASAIAQLESALKREASDLGAQLAVQMVSGGLDSHVLQSRLEGLKAFLSDVQSLHARWDALTAGTAVPAAPAAGAGAEAPVKARRGRRPRAQAEKAVSTPAPSSGDVTPNSELRAAALEALRSAGRALSLKELTQLMHESSLGSRLKPADHVVFPNGLERWQFLTSRELGALKKEGSAEKDANGLWRAA